MYSLNHKSFQRILLQNNTNASKNNITERNREEKKRGRNNKQ